MSRSRSNSNPFPLLRKKHQKDSSPPPPPPPPPRPPRNPTRPSTASAILSACDFPRSSLLLTDISLLRRNKSAGSKLTRPRAHSTSHSSPPPLPRPAVTSRHPPPSTATSLHNQQPKPLPKLPQFSTADRTILEELKRSLSARDAQFTLKNVNRTKHHPFSIEQVPYPRSYARDAVDMDVWETAVCQQIAASLTFHAFNPPPTKVLDIGCGPGTWILDCARSWRSSHFVGLDIVPLHPDLQRVGSSDLASRITWVQANFLEGLPFPNDEFDFVHIKRIARGVPEHKWDPLLEEITRVMKPGAAFEMIEEDLFFPSAYRPSTDLDSNDNPAADADPDKQSLTDSSDSPPVAFAPTPPRSVSPSSMATLVYIDNNAPQDDSRRDKVIHTPHKHLPPPRHQYQRPRNGSAPALPLMRTKSNSVTSELITPLRPQNKLPSQTVVTRPPSHPGRPNASLSSSSRSSSFLGSTPSLTSHVEETPRSIPKEKSMFLLRSLPRVPVNPSDHSVLERIYTEMHTARFINLAPLSLLANSLGVYFKDVRTHSPLQMSFPPRVSRSRAKEYCGAATDGELAWDSGSDSEEPEATTPLATFSRTAYPTQARRTPGLPRPSPPLRSLHSPPPPPPPPLRRYGSAENVWARGPVDQRWVSARNLLEGTSPYVSLDNFRMSSFSPAGKALFPLPGRHSSPFPLESRFPAAMTGGGEMMRGNGPRGVQHLPNPTMNFDLQTLNLHLAVRTTEVLACAEAMWEWVVEYQRVRRERMLRARVRSGSVDELGGRARMMRGAARSTLVDSHPSTDAVMDAIAELTRADFDGLLSQYDVDMRHHMAIGTVLRDKYSWPNACLPPTRDGKASDSAYDEWEQWERQQQQQQQPQRRTHSHAEWSSYAQPGPMESSDTLVPDVNVTTHASNHQRRAAPALVHNADRRQLSPDPSVTPLCRSLRVFAAWKA